MRSESAMAQPALDKRNLRTGLLLGALALALFVGVLLKYFLLK